MDDEKAPAASLDPAVLGIDPDVPSVARIYDYYLGGRENFPSDRAKAEEMIRLAPGAVEAARENRAFLGRVVHTLAAEGVRQFIDIGAGLPTQENVHQIVQRIDPDSRTVYVDFDPAVLVHARALLTEADNAVVVEGDARHPAAVFGDPALRAHIDLTRPVAVLLIALTHFLSDEHADALVGHVRRAVPSGSYLAITQMFPGDHPPEYVKEAAAVYSGTNTGGVVGRGRAHIASWFDGMELLEPGVARVESWRPPAREGGPAGEADEGAPGILGAVGRIP
ncbi:SAM-dependent methyltransferase [Streptosporangium sp. NPDC050855]|uniref:SAM-dependent methyltransferase n=1 Tax=Streptosporangium sp. NPDC050855 TaxID=3366194 RepID=UPI003795DD77